MYEILRLKAGGDDVTLYRLDVKRRLNARFKVGLGYVLVYWVTIVLLLVRRKSDSE